MDGENINARMLLRIVFKESIMHAIYANKDSILTVENAMHILKE